MRSSISSSDNHLRRHWVAYASYVAIALATTVVLAGVVAALWAWTPLRHRPMDVAGFALPTARFSYLAADGRSGHVDHYVLFQGLGAVGDRLRAAQVLFVGNSRLMFALPHTSLREFFIPRGLRYYVAGFGHVESNRFVSDLIERLDLRPTLVVVNADETFFTDELSDWADMVVDTSTFDAMKYRAEAEATHWVRRRLHRLVPHLLEIYRNEPEFIVYRSAVDGSWLVEWDRLTSNAAPVPPDTATPIDLDARTIAIARRFQAEVAARGGSLVFCSVPSPRVSGGHARALARIMNVPYLDAGLEGLEHFDGSHLTPASARRYSEALLAELDAVIREQFPSLLAPQR